MATEKNASHVTEQVELPVLPVYPPILRCLNTCHSGQGKSVDHMFEMVISDPGLTFLACRFVVQQSGINSGNPGHLLAQLKDMPSGVFLAITRWSLAWQHAQQTPLLNEGSHYYWYRSLNHAFVGQILAEKTGLFTPDSGYMMGLFLDMGRLDFLKESRGQYLVETLSLSADERFALEKERFFYTAEERGSRLVEPMSRTSFLADALRYQAGALEQVLESDALIRAAVLTSRLVSASIEGQAIPFDEARQLFDLKKNDVTDLLAKAQTEWQERLALLMEYGLPDQGQMPQFSIERIEIIAGSKQKANPIGEEYHDLLMNEAGRSLAEEAMQSLFAGCDHDNALRQAISQSFSLFFGDCRGVLLLREGDTLQFYCGCSGKMSLLQKMTIPLSIESSHIVGVMRSGEASQWSEHDLDPAVTVVQDMQLMSLLVADQIHAFPLTIAGQTEGVVILGFDKPVQDEWAQLLMPAFASTLSQVLQQSRKWMKQQVTIQDELTEAFQSHLGVLAHEVKNPLNIITNYLYLLGGKLEEGHPAQEHLAVISTEVERITNILKQARNAEFELSLDQVDINQTIEKQLQLIESGLLDEKGVSTRLHLQEGLVKLQTDRDAIKQILVNLLKNAAEAVEKESGVIEVSTFVATNGEGKQELAIEVRDNGPGIPEEVRPHLFQRVESTKGGEHSGVGLSVVNSLVAQLDGRITCRTADTGTVFTILLPYNEQGEG